MKALLMRAVEWVSHRSFVERLSDNEFFRGIVVGAAAGIILLLIIRFLLWVIFRKRTCPEIIVKNSDGKIIVNAAAITGVLKCAIGKLECLEIEKILIYRKARGFRICIRAKMDAAQSTAPRLIESVSRIVKDQMANVFGVTNVLDVTLNIASCKSGKKQEQSQNTKVENAAFGGGNDDFDDDDAEDIPETVSVKKSSGKTVSLKMIPRDNVKNDGE